MFVELSINCRLCDSDIRAGTEVLLRSASDCTFSILANSPVVSYITYKLKSQKRSAIFHSKAYQHYMSIAEHNVRNVNPLATAIPCYNSPPRWSPAERYPFHLSSLSVSFRSILHLHDLLGFRLSCIGRNKSNRSDWPWFAPLREARHRLCNLQRLRLDRNCHPAHVFVAVRRHSRHHIDRNGHRSIVVSVVWS